jgi:hypothetical protein
VRLEDAFHASAGRAIRGIATRSAYEILTGEKNKRNDHRDFVNTCAYHWSRSHRCAVNPLEVTDLLIFTSH